jgi:ADP-heptose:LPS heptosyltransferase
MPAFELKSRRYAVIHLSGRGQFRRLDLNIAKDLKEKCIAAGLTPVFTGIGDSVPPELEINAINLVDKTSLTDLLPLLSGAELIFGPDTGVTHLAASLGVKTVVMMGPSQPRLVHSELFFPNRVFHYSEDLSCRSTKKLHGYSVTQTAYCKGFVCSNSEQGFCVNDSNQNAYIRLAKEQIRKTHAWRPL